MRPLLNRLTNGIRSDGGSPPWAERTVSLVVGVAVLVSLAIFAAPLFEGKVLTLFDLGVYHVPIRYAYHEALHRGESFLWLPLIFCGYYVHGEGQAGMCHPLHLLLYRLLPLETAVGLEIVLTYPFLFAGAFFLFRRWTIPPWAAAYGAFSCAFSTFCVRHYVHPNMVVVWAHVPWMLLCIAHVFHAQHTAERMGALATLAVLTGSQLLLGFPQSVCIGAWAEGIYAITLALETRRGKSALSRLAFLAAAKAFGIALGAVQLLPQWDLLNETTRAATSLEFRSSFSLHPLNLAQLCVPYFFNDSLAPSNEGMATVLEFAVYTGFLPFLGMLWLVSRRKREGNVAEACCPPAARWTLVALAAVGLALALGHYTPLYPLLSRLPVLKAFRAPCRHLALVHFAMAAAAAFAVADVARKPAEPPAKGTAWPILAPALFAAAAAAVLMAIRPDPATLSAQSPLRAVVLATYLRPNASLAVNVALLAVGATLFLGVRRYRILLPALIALACFDQAWYGLQLVHEDTPMDLDTREQWILNPPDRGDFRVDWVRNNMLIMRDIPNVSGYTGPLLARQLVYSEEHVNALRTAGAAWLLRSGDNGVATARVVDPLPFARLVSEFQVTSDPARVLETIEPARIALVSEDPGPIQGPPGKIASLTRTPTTIAADLEVPARQILVIAESYHRGWRAELDGNPVPVFRVYGDFMGCLVKAGTRHVEFRFDPDSFRWGKNSSLAAVALLAVWIAAWAVFAYRESVRFGPAKC